MSKNSKLPGQCQSIDEIREEIDHLDEEIIALLGKRFLYVKEIVRFKSTREEIVATDRYNAVISNRRELALRNNLSPDIIEKMYRLLIAHFIEEENKILESKI